MPIPKNVEKIRPQSAKDIVCQTVRHWIIEGILNPGERLSDEELAEYFSISRTPIREAFQLLEAQKLIRVLPGKATIVAELDLSKIKQWYLPLARLQGLAAELACSCITPQQIKSLRKLNLLCGNAGSENNLKELIKADDAFHNLILAAAGNELILEFSSVLISHVRRAEYQFYRAEGGKFKSMGEHEKIIHALEQGDAAAADLAMQENWLSTVRHFEAFTSQDVSAGLERSGY